MLLVTTYTFDERLADPNDKPVPDFLFLRRNFLSR